MSMRISLLLLLMFVLAACQTDDPAVGPTPSATTAVTLVTPPISPTNSDSPPTNTAVPQPTEAPTIAPTQPPAPPPAPTGEPTALPGPEGPVDSITLAPIITGGLTRPVFLTHAGDGRLFIVEQPGQIKIWADGALLPQPFLDIRGQVSTDANERGLFSIAFHPDYLVNGRFGYGRFFINYTNRQGDSVISRWQVELDNPNRAEQSSEEILLTISQPFGNHNGGGMAFGPDGYLYIGMGDGGSAGDPENNGQNPATLLGAMLRLDIDNEGGGVLYSIPASNPFVADDAVRNEIWSIGWRNPWRFSFDRLTGDLYVADVGQNQWEEIDFQPAASPGGENYGWNILEGEQCFRGNNCDAEGLAMPVFVYRRGQNCAITGGYVYRGQSFPALAGNYFFGDYCSGLIGRLFLQGDGSWDTAVVLESDLTISSFGEDAAGELYVLNHSGGAIYQIQP